MMDLLYVATLWAMNAIFLLSALWLCAIFTSPEPDPKFPVAILRNALLPLFVLVVLFYRVMVPHILFLHATLGETGQAFGVLAWQMLLAACAVVLPPYPKS
jgi:hypothetical protein